jgi:hypothetical protein
VDAENGLTLFLRRADGEVSPIEQRPAGGSRRLRTLLLATPGYGFLSEHSELFALFKRALTSVFRHSAQKRVTVEGAAEIQVNQDAFVRDGLPMIDAEIRWLDREVRGNGGTLAVLYLPVREDVYVSSGPSAEQVRWKSAAMNRSVEAECGRDGIPFLDLGPYVRRRAAGSAEALYFEGGDTHPNARGYDAFAAGAAEFLESLAPDAGRGRPSGTYRSPRLIAPGTTQGTQYRSYWLVRSSAVAARMPPG